MILSSGFQPRPHMPPPHFGPGGGHPRPHQVQHPPNFQPPVWRPAGMQPRPQVSEYGEPVLVLSFSNYSWCLSFPHLLRMSSPHMQFFPGAAVAGRGGPGMDFAGEGHRLGGKESLSFGDPQERSQHISRSGQCE